MAGTVTVPRASAISSASLVPVSGSSISALRLRFNNNNNNNNNIHSLRSSTKVIVPPRRIVCEATQDTTTVQVPGVNDASWKSLVLESDSPVLVEFWAPWCGPCRMIHPLIDKLAKDYAGKLNCYKVNTDESPTIATEYGIRSIPTVIIFKDGQKKEAVIGAVPESTLTTCIDKFL